jgi:hypothetical protein
MSSPGEVDETDYSILDENQAARLVVLREITKATTTRGAMASTGLAYTAGDMMCLCEWVMNGMSSLGATLSTLPRSESDDA